MFVWVGVLSVLGLDIGGFMLEVIGFIVWVVVTVLITLYPIAILIVSDMGGGLSKLEGLFIASFLLLAGYSWYHIFSSVSINLG